MKLRRNILPKAIDDIGATLFLTTIVPLTFWFEVWVVVPDVIDSNSICYYIHCFIGAFIVFNILSNMLAVMVHNTSIIGRKIVQPADANPRLWKFCAICETITPPRSWHCSTCQVCILKRDHHCTFTGRHSRINKTKQFKFHLKSKFFRLLHWSLQSSLLCNASLLLIHWNIVCKLL